MHESLDASLVRIRTPDGRVVGAGFLVGARQILTCAHVVSQALGRADSAVDPPQGVVSLDFPLISPRTLSTAKVVQWCPLLADGHGDIAGLELQGEPPAGAEVVRITPAEDVWEHAFRAFGFPTSYDDGVWATGRLLGRQATDWVMIEDVKAQGFAVGPGFSGTPVWDTLLQGVVGMVVAASRPTETKAAFVIPLDVLVAAWPLIEPITRERIFLSAAPADAAFADRLLSDLQARDLVVWTEQQTPGETQGDQEERVRQAIRAAQAVVVVVSSQTRSSRTIREHLRLADLYQRRLLLVWVGDDAHTPAPPPGWRETIWVDARDPHYAAALEAMVATLGQRRSITALLGPSARGAQEEAHEPRNPYKGLHAFTANDAGDFFGRERLVDELVKDSAGIVAAERPTGDAGRLLAVIGPSGLGKSSVVMAGLLPRLQRGALPGSAEWVYLMPMVPGKHPIEALGLTLAPHFPDRSFTSIREDLSDDATRGLHVLAMQLVKQRASKVVLLIDQFEELFTQTESEDERQRFIDLLVTAVTEPRGALTALLTLRADFSDRPMHYPSLGYLIERQRQAVFPMELDDLRAVIEQPAALPDVQLTFEGNLVGDLLFEMQGQIGALPLLEFALEQLFERRSDHRLTLQAYREIGGVKGALSQHAEKTYAALPSGEHRELVQVLFWRLIDLGTTEQDVTRRRAARSEFSLPDATRTRLLQETTDAFIEARLLTSNEVAGTTTIELSHEAVIREWRRLADWLVTNRNDILLQKAVSEDAAEWIRRGKPNDRLYRGTQLTEAQVLAERTILSVDEVAFLQAGAVEREREQAERAREEAERALQERELGLQRLAARRLRYLSSMTAVTAVVLVVGLLVSLVFYAQLQASLPASVTSLNDHGPGSLREAIKNASPGSTISFAKNVKGTISLTSGELVITKNLIIAGPGSSMLSISGNNRSRVFNIRDGVTATISGLTIENGRTTDSGGDIPNNGGGILNNGVLTLTYSTISGCVSIDGGGIDNYRLLTVTNSTISGNTADGGNRDRGYGGGIFNNGTLNITRSTVSHNTAHLAGGGIDDGYTLLLENSTIANNSTTSGWGGGINVGDGGQASIFQSTIYGNAAATSGGNIHTYAAPVKLSGDIIAGGNARQGKDIWGPVISFAHGYNLIATLDGAILRDDGWTPIYLTGSPNVGSLQDNGGPTQTIALLPGSSAIDFIPLNGCPSTTDQRGMPRPDGNVPACDVGAYESSGLSTATAQAKANATAEAVANTSPIAYPPHNQSPVLTDPLQDNSQGNNWEEDPSNGNCKFIHRAYDINTNQQEWCPARATDFANFIYEVQMKIVTGDGGGIAFRINPDPRIKEQQYHYFAINQDGSYSIQEDDIVLASGSSPAIHRGLNQTNQVAAIVHGQIIELYVNLQRVAVVSTLVGSRTSTHGRIGVIVIPSGHHQTEVIFQNAKVWTL